MTSQPVVNTSLPLSSKVLLGVAILIALQCLPSFQRFQELENVRLHWSQTPGTVVENTLLQGSGGTLGIKDSKYTALQIIYEYAVDGKTYRGHYLDYYKTVVKDKAVQYHKNLLPGTQLTVFYQDRQPALEAIANPQIYEPLRDFFVKFLLLLICLRAAFVLMQKHRRTGRHSTVDAQRGSGPITVKNSASNKS